MPQGISIDLKGKLTVHRVNDTGTLHVHLITKQGANWYSSGNKDVTLLPAITENAV